MDRGNSVPTDEASTSAKPGSRPLPAHGMTVAGWESFFAGIGEPNYRAVQAFEAVHVASITRWSEATVFPKPLRDRLSELVTLAPLPNAGEHKSSDGTIKLLFEPDPGNVVESVIIPTKYGPALCLSTQIGCPVGCLFCQTGQMGLGRSLSAAEIVGQFVSAERRIKRELNSIILMGMGEPMLNAAEVSKALEILTHPKGRRFAKRRITVSTVGYPAKVREMAERGWKYNIALSLHATNEETRRRLIPVAVKQPLAEIFAALEDYQLAAKSDVTLEYILLAGINVSPDDARALAYVSRWGWRAELEDPKWLRNFFARAGARNAAYTRDSWKVNLIPYNPTTPNAKSLRRLAGTAGIHAAGAGAGRGAGGAGRAGSPSSSSQAWTLECPAEEEMEGFLAQLTKYGARATLRRPRGRDIGAACGMLGKVAGER